MTLDENPWLRISPEEYEGHMSSPSVKQLDFLSGCFKHALEIYLPSDVAVVGCGTGNGLEHIDNSYTKRTTVIDINPEFLEHLRLKYERKLSGLEIVCSDLCSCELSQQYSLVYAGLVFEFVDTKILLRKISKWLNPGGIFRVVLQRPTPNLPMVSDTQYENLKRLKKIVNLVELEVFRSDCDVQGLEEIAGSLETLRSSKSFYVGTFKKARA